MPSLENGASARIASERFEREAERRPPCVVPGEHAQDEAADKECGANRGYEPVHGPTRPREKAG